MKMWNKLSPVLWPVAGAIIILSVMVIATKMAWQSKGTADRNVAKEINRDNGDHKSTDKQDDEIDLVQPSTTAEKKTVSPPPTVQPKFLAPTLPVELGQPAKTKADAGGNENFSVVTHNKFPLNLEGYCPVTLVNQKKWQKGDPRWSADHQGRSYLFVSYQQQQQFLADATRYSPVASGNDVVEEKETGRRMPGRRSHGLFHKERIFLFASENTLQTFLDNPDRYIARVGLKPNVDQVVVNTLKDSAGYMEPQPIDAVMVEGDDCCCEPCCRRLFGRRCR